MRTEAEPCTLSRETLNICTVVPETGRLLRTVWRSTRDIFSHLTERVHDDTSRFIKAGLGRTVLVGILTNAYVINLHPCGAGNGVKVNMRPLLCAPMQENSRHTGPTIIPGPAQPGPLSFPDLGSATYLCSSNWVWIDFIGMGLCSLAFYSPETSDNMTMAKFWK